jgi:hypothetical protein
MLFSSVSGPFIGWYFYCCNPVGAVRYEDGTARLVFTCFTKTFADVEVRNCLWSAGLCLKFRRKSPVSSKPWEWKAIHLHYFRVNHNFEQLVTWIVALFESACMMYGPRASASLWEWMLIMKLEGQGGLGTTTLWPHFPLLVTPPTVERGHAPSGTLRTPRASFHIQPQVIDR